MTKKLIMTDDNKKLVSNSNVAFMRFNIPAVKTCPYACNACKKSCYALKPERIYPTVRESRNACYMATFMPDFVDRIIAEIEHNLTLKKYKDCKKVVVRIHESGDFYSVEYLKKWLSVVDYFKDNKQLIFCAYTKSVPFLKELGFYSTADLKSRFPGLVLSVSVWGDMPEAMQAEYFTNWKTYTAMTSTEIEAAQSDKTFHFCRCSDCATCMHCMTYATKKTACLIH